MNAKSQVLFLSLSITAMCALNAQPQHLATDYKGSVLYFSSKLSQPGQSDEPHSKLFRWEAKTGLQVFLVRPRIIDTTPLRGGWRTNNFKLDWPSLSSDGTRLAYAGYQEGLFGPITIAPLTELTIQDPAGNIIQRGNVPIRDTKIELSRNGRYFVWWMGVQEVGTSTVAGPSASISGQNALGATGESISFRQSVSDDGWMIYIEGPQPIVGLEHDHLTLLSANVGPKGQLTKRFLHPGTPPIVPIISASGTMAVYESKSEDGIPRRLLSLNIASGKETLLFTDSAAEYFGSSSPSLLGFFPYTFFSKFVPFPAPIFDARVDDSGSTVMALVRERPSRPRQWVLLVASDSSSPQWLAFASEGYREASLSGNGKVVFAVTEYGRLLRIDAITGEVREILPRTPWVDSVEGAWKVGAENKIRGGGFSTVGVKPGTYPAPTELGGVRVELNGIQAPLLKVSPKEVVYQIPWEFQFSPPLPQELPDMPVRVVVHSESPLLQQAVENGGAYIQIMKPGAMHADRTPLTNYKPARPGEILTLVLTGLSSPSGVTGVPSKTSTGEMVTGFDCSLDYLKRGTDPVPLVPQFFGLRPGKIGEYEFRFQLPAPFAVPADALELVCRNDATRETIALYFPSSP